MHFIPRTRKTDGVEGGRSTSLAQPRKRLRPSLEASFLWKSLPSNSAAASLSFPGLAKNAFATVSMRFCVDVAALEEVGKDEEVVESWDESNLTRSKGIMQMRESQRRRMYRTSHVDHVEGVEFEVGAARDTSRSVSVG